METCKENEVPFSNMDMFISFSDPLVAKGFNVKACTWAFGMNLFDLREWRRNLVAVYHKYLQLVSEYIFLSDFASSCLFLMFSAKGEQELDKCRNKCRT